MDLVFATHNAHKAKEIRKILPEGYRILDLAEVNFFDEIEETGETLEENAAIKAGEIYRATGLNCFADDTGLEVEALGGRPGVYSARYAGEQASFEDNIELLLEEMKDRENRKASFRTVICLLINGEKHFFEGKVEGDILHDPKGEKGFGYDPVFLPTGENLSFAEMTLSSKNKISHRSRAFTKMMEFLQNNNL